MVSLRRLPAVLPFWMPAEKLLCQDMMTLSALMVPMPESTWLVLTIQGLTRLDDTRNSACSNGEAVLLHRVIGVALERMATVPKDTMPLLIVKLPDCRLVAPSVRLPVPTLRRWLAPPEAILPLNDESVFLPPILQVMVLSLANVEPKSPLSSPMPKIWLLPMAVFAPLRT